jgi:cytochrome c oxidase subunit 2
MIGDVVVMTQPDYEAWMAGKTGGTMASSGSDLFQSLGCVTCHRADAQGRGPSLVGIYGKPVLLEDGRTVVADDNYVRESIMSPAAKVVNGYKPIMPVFQGLVTDEQLNSLVAYVKSLSQPPAGTQSAAADTKSSPKE